MKMLDVDAMALNTVYREGKHGNILFVAVPPGHIQTEIVKTSIEINKAVEKKRKFDEFIKRELYLADWRSKTAETHELRVKRKNAAIADRFLNEKA